MNAGVELHPALKESVLLTPRPSGVHVGSAGRGFFMNGGNLATLVGRILAAIDGSRSLDEIRGGLPGAVTPLFDRIVAQLWDQRLMTLGSLDDVMSGTSHPDTARFAREHSRDWRTCLAAIRGDPVCVAGSGDLVAATSLLLLNKGFGNLLVAADGLRVEHAETIARCADRSGRGEDRPPSPQGRARILPGEEMARHAAPDMILIALEEEGAGRAALPTGSAWAQVECIGGVVANGIAILAPCGPGAIDTARRLARLHTGAGGDFTAAGRSVLAALAAYEAIWARLRPVSDDAAPPRDTFRVIRRDSTVSSHDVGAALAADRPLSPRLADAPAPPAPPGGAVHPGWFDPAHGPFEWVEAQGSGFPLALRSLRVRPRGKGDAGADRIITHWGLDSAAAERRTFGLATALVALETAGLGAVAAAPVFAETRAQAEQLAACLARAGSVAFTRRSGFAAVDPESSADPDLAMLVRLARLYTGELPGLTLADEPGCCIALARSGGFVSCGIAPAADAALVDALGDAIASRQQGAPVTRQELAPYAELARLDPALPEGVGADRDLPVAVDGELCFEPLHALAWEGGDLVVGAAKLGHP